MKDKITQMLASAPGLPVLFIGSGLTRRYLNLPDWEGLLRRFCVKRKYEYYYLKAEQSCPDQIDMLYPKIADYIEADYNEAYLTDEQFSEDRNVHADDINKKNFSFKVLHGRFFQRK